MHDRERQAMLNELHTDKPQPGDYWQEMFCPICVVLEVDDDCVVYCTKTKPVEVNSWTWDLNKSLFEIKTIDEFKDWLSYGSIPGFWCDVLPEQHKWALSAC